MHTPWRTLPIRLASAALAVGASSLSGLALAQSATAPTPAPAASAAKAPAPPAGGIYRWKDANGKVHFGDRAPPNADRVNIRNDAPSAEETQAAQERLQAMQRRSDELAAERRGQPASSDTPPVETSTEDRGEAPPNETACQAQWRAYNTSYACFNPYRTANGSVKAEGFKHCKSVTRPSCTP